MGMPEVNLREFIHMDRDTSDWTRLLDDLYEDSLLGVKPTVERIHGIIKPYADKWGVTIQEVAEKLEWIDEEMEKKENL